MNIRRDNYKSDAKTLYCNVCTINSNGITYRVKHVIRNTDTPIMEWYNITNDTTDEYLNCATFDDCIKYVKDCEISKYEIGSRVNNNIYYTGYTINATSVEQAIEIYKEKSGYDGEDFNIVANKLNI